MTPDEFEFWQRAYLAAMAGLYASGNPYVPGVPLALARNAADFSLEHYRETKATVVD